MTGGRIVPVARPAYRGENLPVNPTHRRLHQQRWPAEAPSRGERRSSTAHEPAAKGATCGYRRVNKPQTTRLISSMSPDCMLKETLSPWRERVKVNELKGAWIGQFLKG